MKKNADGKEGEKKKDEEPVKRPRGRPPKKTDNGTCDQKKTNTSEPKKVGAISQKRDDKNAAKQKLKQISNVKSELERKKEMLRALKQKQIER